MLLLNRHTRTTTYRLTIFSSICLILVSVFYFTTSTTIEKESNRALLMQFQDILPNQALPPDLLETSRTMMLNNIPIIIYDAIIDGRCIAHFIRASTNKGYAGNITLLIAIAPDNKTLLGVRTLSHNETPGLGDKIDTRISDWILAFSGQSLMTRKFSVKKDGGDFDEFTGATITPRAVTNLVNEILHAWQNRDL